MRHEPLTCAMVKVFFNRECHTLHKNVRDLEDRQTIVQQRSGMDPSRGAMRDKGSDLQKAVAFLWLDHRLVKDDQKRGQKSCRRDLISLGLKCFTICLVGSPEAGECPAVGWALGRLLRN